MPGAIALVIRTGAIAVALAAATAAAQTDDDQSTPIDEETLDEIIVVAPKPGDQVDLEARYEAQLRDRLQKEMGRLRDLEEEYEWRTSEALEVDEPSRIKWGYDPRVELEMRRDTELTDLPIDNTKPATLFRFQF